jgi:ecotin
MKRLFTFLVTVAMPSSIGAAENLTAFPPAEKAMTRHVLPLPEKEDESLFRVEILVGKTIEVDTVNKHFFGGVIEAVTIEGWGFTRYVVEELGPMAGTLVAPPHGAAKTERFVSLGGDPYLVRYNSKLPVVVYVPEGAEVRYRIWSADPGLETMEEG